MWVGAANRGMGRALSFRASSRIDVRCNAWSTTPKSNVLTPQPVIGFPHDLTRLDGQAADNEQLIEMLAPYMTEERVTRIERVIKNRTYSVLPVVEGLYDMGNLAAVCRTADAFGLGSVHCINRSDEKYKQSMRTAKGSDRWLDVSVWNSATDCAAAVKAAGYQLVVTHLRESSVGIQDIDFTRPTAFVLGNEKFGVSDEMVAAADVTAVIPMDGFVESFNISVAAALIMYEARQQRLGRLGRHGDLTSAQQTALKAAFMMRSVRESDTLIRELLARPPPSWQASRFKTKP